MKKIVMIITSLLLSVMCLFGLTACSKGDTIKIGAQTDTTGFMFAGYLKGVEVKGYQTPALAAADLENGTLDYVIVDKAVAQQLCKNNTALDYIDIALTGSEQFAMGVNKADSALKEQINSVLAEKESQIIDIINKYNSGDEANYVGIPAVTKNLSNQAGQLVVATNAEYPPFEFKQGENFYGIDMEIAKLIADELGMELVIEDMQFESVVTSVGTNGIDVAIAALTVTAEREGNVNFANPYYFNEQVIVKLKSNTKLNSAEYVMDILAVICSKA